jgi:hypothetical protein
MKTLAGRGYLLVSLVVTLFALAPTAAAQIKRPEDPVALPSPFERSQEIDFTSRYPTPGGIPIKREPQVLKKGLLAPSMQDRLQHDAFLKQSKTGLIRLMPREVYDWERYKVPARIDIRGGGAYFSFFHRTHEYGYGSDLQLARNKFSVGFAGGDYGMIVDLGDVSIDEISETDSRFVFLSNYEPSNAGSEATGELMRFNNGVRVDDPNYRRTVPARSQSTYLVRSIAFGTSDVLVAFRVVRFDTDGSAIIAWKLLKSFSTPYKRKR